MLLAVLVSLAGLLPQLELQRVKPDYTKSKLTAKEKKKDVLVGCRFTLDDGVVVEVIDVLYRPHGVIGRGNIVVRVKCVKISGAQAWIRVNDVFIVKIGDPSESREAETNLIQTAVNAAKDDEHKWVLNHLPHVLYQKTFKFRVGSTERSLLNLHPNDYEERVVRIVVQESLDQLSSLQSATEFAQVFYDIFQCSSLALLYLGLSFHYAFQVTAGFMTIRESYTVTSAWGTLWLAALETEKCLES